MSGPLRLPARAGFHVKDVPAGLVLGVQSVPSGLAGGLLAGLSPLTGLYAYLFGTLFIAGATMICTVLAFAELVGYIAMPSLAGLLIVVGFKSMKVEEALLVLRTGSVQAALMGLTFLLTILIPLQYAVLTGVGLSIIMHVARQSNALRLVDWDFDPDGGVREHDPPAALPAHRVLVLRPYGSRFFAAAHPHAHRRLGAGHAPVVRHRRHGGDRRRQRLRGDAGPDRVHPPGRCLSHRVGRGNTPGRRGAVADMIPDTPCFPGVRAYR